MTWYITNHVQMNWSHTEFDLDCGLNQRCVGSVALFSSKVSDVTSAHGGYPCGFRPGRVHPQFMDESGTGSSQYQTLWSQNVLPGSWKTQQGYITERFALVFFVNIKQRLLRRWWFWMKMGKWNSLQLWKRPPMKVPILHQLFQLTFFYRDHIGIVYLKLTRFFIYRV